MPFLSGSLPSSISSLQNLEEITISSTAVTGISSEICDCQALTKMYGSYFNPYVNI